MTTGERCALAAVTARLGGGRADVLLIAYLILAPSGQAQPSPGAARARRPGDKGWLIANKDWLITGPHAASTLRDHRGAT